MNSATQQMTASVFDDRRKVLAWVHLAAGIALTLFIVVHYIEQCCFALSMIEAGLAVVMIFTYWRIRTGAELFIIENTLMVSAIVLFSALLFLESIENTGVYWIAGFPFVAYFVHPARLAKYWIAAYVTELIIVGSAVAIEVMHLPYSSIQIYCLVAIVLFFSVLAHIYKSQLELRQQQLADSNRQLEKQQGQMQVVLDHSPVGIWMVDASRRIQFLNRVWTEWFGVSEEQARAASDYSQLLSEELAGKSLASDEACLDSDGAYHFRDEVACADGKIRVFDAIKVKVFDTHGTVVGIVGFAIDISDKIHSEREQRELERQVQHSQRLEALGVMAGGVAHDFNNLLTAIQGSVELSLMEENLSDSMQESLACINSAAQAATDLCRQMLTYSGRNIIKTEPLNVQELVKGMHSLLEVSAGKHADLNIEFDERPTMVRGDSGQISQVLLNLVINASEAIGSEGHGKISLRLGHHDLKVAKTDMISGVELEPGCYVVITVEDNGCGMDSEVTEHMFDPFFTTKFTGRGLGLSTILGILRSHQAGMKVDSRLKEGTSIAIWLPCYCEEEVERHEEHHSESKSIKSAKVLIVDDEPQVAYVAKRMLEKLGLDVMVVGGGGEAIELFSSGQNSFDWVLLDVTMPEMDGVECLQKLREIDPNIYVTMSSGYDADSALDRDGLLQPDDFLSKPYTFDALRAVVDRAASV